MRTFDTRYLSSVAQLSRMITGVVETWQHRQFRIFQVLQGHLKKSDTGTVLHPLADDIIRTYSAINCHVRDEEMHAKFEIRVTDQTWMRRGPLALHR